MVGSAVAITVESRFCMNIALATITAVNRVRLLVRSRAGGEGAVESLIAELSVASLPMSGHRRCVLADGAIVLATALCDSAMAS